MGIGETKYGFKKHICCQNVIVAGKVSICHPSQTTLDCGEREELITWIELD